MSKRSKISVAPKRKLGRPKKESVLNELERNWIKVAYSRGANKYLISRCFHVDPLDISRFCDKSVPVRCISNNVLSFEEVFLKWFNGRVRLLMNDWLRKLKIDSIGCHDCRITLLSSPTDCDLDWCYHNTQQQVEEHLQKLQDTIITCTWKR